MVEPGEIVCPEWPELYCAVTHHLDKQQDDITVPLLNWWTSHLYCLVYVEDQADGVAQEEHGDDGEQHGGHGGVPAVARGYAVVKHRGPENS